MARLINGLLGGLSGALGNLDVYMLNGKMVYRTRRAKSTKPHTEKQLVHQMKWRLVVRFLGAFTEFIRVGFSDVTIGTDRSANNAAMSWHVKNAIAGEYPDFTIDYAAVRLSEGSMNTQGINAAATIKDDKLIFTWRPDLSYAHANDNVMLLAYAPAYNEAVYKVRGANRKTGTDELMLSANCWDAGTEVHTWLSFITEKGTKCTNSIYLGGFNTHGLMNV